MKIGDRLHCQNGKCYTLGEPTKREVEWSTMYDVSLVDENGEVVEEVTMDYLSCCIVENLDERLELVVGLDEQGGLIRTKVRCLEIV